MAVLQLSPRDGQAPELDIVKDEDSADHFADLTTDRGLLRLGTSDLVRLAALFAQLGAVPVRLDLRDSHYRDLDEWQHEQLQTEILTRLNPRENRSLSAENRWRLAMEYIEVEARGVVVVGMTLRSTGGVRTTVRQNGEVATTHALVDWLRKALKDVSWL